MDGKAFTLFRLWTLRRAANIPAAASDAAIIGLGAVSIALWIALDRWQAGSGARFQLWDTFTISFYGMFSLLVAFALSRASRPRVEFRSVLYVMAALLPFLVACGFWIIWRLDGPVAVGALALLSLYAIAYTFTALRSLSGGWQVRAVTVAIVLLGVITTYGRMMELSPTLWAPAASDDTADASDMAPSVAEGLLFDQRALIDDAVDRMSEVRGAEPAIFFVGFAGVAEQRVFAEEIKLAARVIDERFDASARQLLLINDRRDLDTFPIATASGLGYALGAISEKMNPDRDILFLALSSHGSADTLLSVSNGTLPLEQLSDDDLETALRESGIKWRVIVISACYAGGFIDSLKNPDTIVITAAAADKASFGCSDDRDLTYFGEAFYRDALPNAKTLEEAFEQAKAAIAVREKQEHQTPSDPQAFFGKDITDLLDRHPMRAERHRTLSAAAL